MNEGAFAKHSSVRELAGRSGTTFAELLRGTASLGGLLEAEGYRAVPSPGDPDPGGAPYFSAGYSTARHGSRDGGTVSGIQLEHQYQGIRDSESSRSAYAEALAEIIDTYLSTHYAP